ncbi:MAG: phytoene desaturase [Deltaproteobacteria bacterium]|jgi:diapolycopene oxygenase|nr:phytoene desaturase [Deltaproteobacteria bacterium]MBW2530196.1 phytoene desaturase [Deltaproteobacteria bacterium]
MAQSGTTKKIVVIGGGLGGMSAAISLATQGFEVELFEKNDKLGGKLNLLEKDGYSFDLGPSLIILPHLFRRLFEAAGHGMEEYVEFQELSPQWRSVFEDGMVLDLYSDMRLMERELEKVGAEAEGYWSFIEYSRKLYKFAEEAYLERGSDTVRQIVAGYNAIKAFYDLDIHASMHQGIRRHVKEPHLVQMLDFFIKYVGSSAFDSPALMNLLPYSQLGYGEFYVKGGMYNLARGMRRLMDDLGVVTHVGREVTRIEASQRSVRGIELADGTFVAADVVVSNMEVIPAYERLLGEKGAMMAKYRRIYEPACSGLVIHLGVDKQYDLLRHHNFYFARDAKKHWDQIHHDKVLPDDPTLYVVCPTKTDPALAPEGHDIVKILPHIPYAQPEPFSAADYDALKERVYDKMERMGLRNLRKHIVVEDVLVPEDIERMYYSNKGAIYGVVSDRKKNLALKAPKQSEKYDNLYFVGGSVNPGGGTCMVVLSGQNVGHMIRKRYATA